jgi:hypothetical protein
MRVTVSLPFPLSLVYLALAPFATVVSSLPELLFCDQPPEMVEEFMVLVTVS